MTETMLPFWLLLAAGLGAATACVLLRRAQKDQIATLQRAHEVSLRERVRIGEQLIAAARDEVQRTHDHARQEAESAKQVAVLRATEALRKEHVASLQAADVQYNARLKEQTESALSVIVHPFVNTQRQSGILSRETLVEVGYKYQLLIQGLPCFQPHTVVVESTREKELNEKMIELFKAKALELAEAAANVKTGGFASKVVSIAKTTIRHLK